MVRAPLKKKSTHAESSSPKQASSRRKSSGRSLHSHRPTLPTQIECREASCENLATTGQYCRMHYIKNWRRIKLKEAILLDGRLQRYIAELVDKYPDKYIEAIQHDLQTDDTFSLIILEFEIPQNDEEFDDMDSGNGVDAYSSEPLRTPPDFEGGNEGF